MSFTHGCLLQVNIVELDHVLKSNASLKIFLIKNISGESDHFLRQCYAKTIIKGQNF